MEANRRAVVVEDDVGLRALMCRLLRSCGVVPVPFGSAESALAWLETRPAPDLVTVDLQLPGVSGLRICDWLRARPATKYVPVVVVTGSESQLDQDAVAERGGTWLQKPFDNVAYRAVVEHLVPALPVVLPSSSRHCVHFHIGGPVTRV